VSRLLWLLAGFCGGVAMARNAPALPAPVAGTVLVCAVVACGVTWWAAYRGKASAVATAVAVAHAEATAIANAEAEAKAAAIAQAALNVYVGLPGGKAVSELVDQLEVREVESGQVREVEGRGGEAASTSTPRTPAAAPWALPY
jgi:hypothetical protein